MKKLFLSLLVLALPSLGLAQTHLDRWAIQHAPAAAATASVSLGAVASRRHVATSVTVCASAGATAQTPLQFSLRDGATGAGTIVWTVRLAAPINTTACTAVPIFIVGSINTAMTIESAGVTVAGAFATVSLNGYDTY